MNEQVRDRETGIRLTEEVDSRDKATRTERSDRLCVRRMMLVVEPG